MKRYLLLLSCYLIISMLAAAQATRNFSEADIKLEWKKLLSGGSVLYIAAHPDDENTRLISWLANDQCMRTAYLSLTRGDGGQNLIGAEQGTALGVIRTRELMAARRTDGGEQFFTRAYDFGFSKNPEETFQKWNRDSILSDMVFVIRQFKPDVIITRFATDGSGGHGHHTASALLAEEAFKAAADPTRFPEQLNRVQVWQTKRLFYNSAARFWNPNADMSGFIKIDVGGFNSLLGKNYGEIAAESRSQHRSQGFGSARQRGEMFEYFKPLLGDTNSLTGLFDRIDNTPRVKAYDEYAKTLAAAKTAWEKGNMKQSTQLLLDIIYKLIQLNQNEDAQLQYYQKKAEDMILHMNGIYAEANAEQALTAAGDSLKVNALIINRSSMPMQLVECSLIHPGAVKEMYDPSIRLDSVSNKTLNYNVPKTIPFKILLNENAPASAMYWLEKPIQNEMFNQDAAYTGMGYALTNRYYVVYSLSMFNKIFRFTRPVQYRWVSPDRGELYRPALITPPVFIHPLQSVLVTADSNWHEMKIRVKAGKDKVNGIIRVTPPTGWEMMAGNPIPKMQMGSTCEAGFSLARKGDETELSFRIRNKEAANTSNLHFEAVVNGLHFNSDMLEITYDHIPTQVMFEKALVRLVKLDLKRNLKKLAYIEGAGDEVATCLENLGYEVHRLTDDELASQNLSQYEAIITGVRAFNTREKLSIHRVRLMEYVNGGGNLIVQYNTNSFAGPFKGEVGPYPFKITRERITDEQAKVVMKDANHAIFNRPNKISEADFEGWIQERSIYHAGDWGTQYQSLLSMHDPGEKDNEGGLIYCRYGKGNFIYTGLVFFRELPAGVPGSYRLMVNLIEAGK